MPLAAPKTTVRPFARPLIVGTMLLCAFLVGRLSALIPHELSAPLPPQPADGIMAPAIKLDTAFECATCPVVHVAALPAENHGEPERLTRLYHVPLLRVVDGDTVYVRWYGEDTKVRLLHINAPERGAPGYHESRRHLEGLLTGATHVDLAFERDRPARDHYGRLLAYLHHEGRNLNTVMVRDGYAEIYDKYKDTSRSSRGQSR